MDLSTETIGLRVYSSDEMRDTWLVDVRDWFYSASHSALMNIFSELYKKETTGVAMMNLITYEAMIVPEVREVITYSQKTEQSWHGDFELGGNNKKSLIDWICCYHPQWVYDLWAEKAQQTYVVHGKTLKTGKSLWLSEVILFSELFSNVRLPFSGSDIFPVDWNHQIGKLTSETNYYAVAGKGQGHSEEAEEVSWRNAQNVFHNPELLQLDQLDAIASNWMKYPNPPEVLKDENLDEFVSKWVIG